MTTLAPSRTAQAVRSVGAALIVAGIVVGLPLLLIAFAEGPWTWHLPSAERLSVALSWPLSANTVKYLLAVAGWAIWIWLTIRLTREVIAQLAGRQSTTRVGGPIRLLAATLVGSVTATAPALAAHAEPDTVVTAPVEQCQTETQQAPEPAPTAEETTPVDDHERDAEGNIIHTVVRRDTIWDLSIKYYGNPDHVDAIFEANKGAPQPTGGQLTNKHRIWPDWKLVMPGTAPEPEPVPPTAPEPPQQDEEPTPAEDTEEPQPSTAEADPETATAPTPVDDSDDAAPATDRGAWMAGSFLAISVLAAAVAFRRRRRKRTGRSDKPTTAPKPGGAVEEDDELTGRLPDLEDLLARQDETDSGATPLATGIEDEDEISILDHAGLGLGLTGPGADAAARACLYTAVLNAANVVCDRACLEQLDLDPDVLADIPEITVTTGPDELLEATRRHQATQIYDEENDELYQEATVTFCDSATGATLTELLDHEHTYAIVLGEWDPHWLELAADGTPTGGNIAEGPASSLGQCYVLDAETGNELFTDLTEPANGEDAPEPPEPTTAPEPEPQLSTPPQPPATTAVTRERDATTSAANTATGQFQLQLFGTHRLTWNGEDVHFRNIACLHLIAVMALTDWELTRDELTMVVAADAHLKQAKSRRTSATNRLRETIAGLTGLEKEQILTFDRSRAVYRLNQDLFATDVAEFDQHLADADEATDPEQRAAHLDAALQRYVAPLGEALDEAWDLVDLRTKYQHRAYQAALDLAALRESEGDLDAAASTLEDATRIFPQEATAWEHLIDLHRRRGDDQAVNQAEQRRRQLRKLTAAAQGR